MSKVISIQEKSKTELGYVSLKAGSPQLYRDLGFKCGLEVHQQLWTKQKLFCRCPAGHYQRFETYDAEILRHMRPTLSELGEYDGTALMEFRTRKNIYYRVKNETACTYEMDDTPPFPINREALDIAIQIALQMRTNIVGELHITRKQYLDGSIPTGFQRTAIVGINGSIPLSGKRVNVIQLSIEEDSCREVSDIGHDRVYTTDRLGMPLIETVTAPELLTPQEAAEGAQVIRLITRSSGRVRTGIGATREDVNVSITGGTRIEIKGVARIAWIPELTHNEAFRQKALLTIMNRLKERVRDEKSWQPQVLPLEPGELKALMPICPVTLQGEGVGARLIRLPFFSDLLPFFTSPGRCFADELSDRLKVIAGSERPNMDYVQNSAGLLDEAAWSNLLKGLNVEAPDAIMVCWGQEADMAMAVEVITERCRLAFHGVPPETRQPRADGTTRFERVLPGADRMYPDTDSAPIPIGEDWVATLTRQLPLHLEESIKQMQDWGVPPDCIHTVHRLAAFPVLDRIRSSFPPLEPRRIATLIGHRYKHQAGLKGPVLKSQNFYDLCDLVMGEGLHPDILPDLLDILCQTPDLTGVELIRRSGFTPMSAEQLQDAARLIVSGLGRELPPKRRRFLAMRALRPKARGNIANLEAWQIIKEQIHD
jgi:glutamyl-tRNA(Gln) amidotransferase subunit E